MFRRTTLTLAQLVLSAIASARALEATSPPPTVDRDPHHRRHKIRGEARRTPKPDARELLIAARKRRRQARTRQRVRGLA